MAEWNGMNWIRKDKRLAIYMRDGMACVYCGDGVAEEIRFTLDHLVPRSMGGDNKASNLVTCCNRCNAKRQDREWREFAAAVAAYVNAGETAERIIARIEHLRHQPLKALRAQARAILARRNDFNGAIVAAGA